MKRLVYFFLSVFILGSAFYSCDNSKTYAEKLADERKAIERYVKEHNIKVISEEEFLKDTVTDLSKNEYVYFDNGVYMQIVDRGSEEVADTFRNGEMILVRFVEMFLESGDTTRVSNWDSSFNPYPEEFRFMKSSTTIQGLFMTDGLNFNNNTSTMATEYGTAVPNGWLVPLQYVRNKAHVKIIVPSKMGHAVSSQYVYPYFYDIRKYERY